MSKIRNLYHELVRRRWIIGIGELKPDFIESDFTHKIQWIDSNTDKSWYADPFIIGENSSSFEIMVEEFPYTTKRGRITYLKVDKQKLKVIDAKVLLELSTHLSFPCYFKENNKIYVYPENSSSGVSNLYVYNMQNKTLEFVNEWCHSALTDAVKYVIEGNEYLLSTVHPNENGNILKVFRKGDDNTYEECQEIAFNENKARNAGLPFVINGKLIRPAQISNTGYGEGIVLQEVINKDGIFSFNDIIRMKSPLKDYPLAFHTMNVYENRWVIYDAQGYKHPLLGPFVSRIINIVKKLVQ